MKKLFHCFIVSLLTCFFLLALPTPARAAKFVLEPGDKTLTSGEQFTVNLYLDTEGKSVNAADATLIYPQNLIWVDKVEYPAVFPMHLQLISRSEGKIGFHFASENQSIRLSGRQLAATLTLSTHAAGTAALAFICDNTQNLNDANAWEVGTNIDLIDCGKLNKGVYTINAKEGASPAPSSSPASVCVAPAAPTGLTAQTGSTGQVIINWIGVDNANYYTITYGLVSHGYIYGAPNIGKTTTFTVSQLAAGRTYYFALTSVNSCGSSGYSDQVSARAGGALPVVTPVEKGGWQPTATSGPSPSLAGSPQATASAQASPSGLEEESPSPSGSPLAFIPPKAEPFWRDWNFWKKAGIVSLILFVLLIIILAIKGRKESEFEATPLEPKEEPWPPQEWPPEASSPSETKNNPPPFSQESLK